ncbi:uncharacterized protein LOC136758173 [Amia ocellicauda]|uniref:uncharacterized protein LOC136758173 n=1 Tax=Amia ocellicauda TaxID=2972642 RepID=UPI0034641983
MPSSLLALLLLLPVGLIGLSEAQGRQQRPQIRVSQSLVSVGGSVSVACETPVSVGAENCSLYRDSELIAFRSQTAVQHRCEFRVTGRELLGQRQTQSGELTAVELSCDYRPSHSASLHSERSTVQMLGDLQKPSLEVRPFSVRETDTVELSCRPPAISVSVSLCRFYTHSPAKQSPVYIENIAACSLSVSGETLLRLRAADSQELQLLCRYAVKSIDTLSPLSEAVTVRLPDEVSLLWRHVLSALVLLATVGFIIESCFSSTQTGAPGSSRRGQGDSGQLEETVC